MTRTIDSGICHVNGPTVHDEAQMPYGGVKGSGIGLGGEACIAEFTELRCITMQAQARHYPSSKPPHAAVGAVVDRPTPLRRERALAA